MKALLDEYINHFEVMSNNKGYDRNAAELWDKLNEDLISKLHKLPGNADEETILKAFDRLDIAKVMKKPEKLGPEVLFLLKKAKAPLETYDYIDEALSFEYLSTFSGEESWKAEWKKVQMLYSKIGRFEYAPSDQKKFNQLKELSAGINIVPLFEALKKYNPFILPENFASTKKSSRPVTVSMLWLLCMEFKPEYFSYLESFIQSETDKETLIGLANTLSFGNEKYLSLKENIISRMKVLCKDRFNIQLLQNIGLEPDWLREPWCFSLEIGDTHAEKGVSRPNNIIFSIESEQEDTFFADVRQNDIHNYYPGFSWHQNPLTINCMGSKA